MRLLAEEKDVITTAIAKYDKNAAVFLFGSRTDGGLGDNQKIHLSINIKRTRQKMNK